MLIQHLIPLQLLIVSSSAQLYYDSEEIVQDWDDAEWTEWREDRQLLFPQEEDECLGEKMTLRGGESAVIKSHKSFGMAPYDDGFRCRWVFRPVECSLGLVCHLQTRTSRSGTRSCQGGDYLRIMKGLDQINFHKKYCGKRTASLKFSGNETVKMVFKSSSNAKRAVGRLDGFTCKVVCLSEDKPLSKPPTTAPITTTTTTTTTTSSPPASSSSKCRCGEPGLEKIICPPGGNCDSSPVPWQVAITYLGSPRPQCGGSLINSRYVLSAAHCFHGTTRRDRLRVRLGELDWSREGETFRKPELELAVDSVLVHPRYGKRAQFDFDFAILKLERPIDFTVHSWLRPVCLPGPSSDSEGEMGRVTGWGWTDPDTSSQSTRLQTLQVSLMSREKCLASSRYTSSQLTDSMTCAVTAGGDSCKGDSGGPLTVLRQGRHQLAGVVSWGISCAKARYPGVYSKVEVVRDWILENSRQAEWCADRPRQSPFSTENRGDRRA